jgi:SAM-dependent methyltransferase
MLGPLIQAIKHRIRIEQFQPRFLGLFMSPFYFARKGLYRNIAALANKITGKTLDVGCGQKPYEHLFRSSSYIGLDMDSPENRKSKRADVFYDGKGFPFPNDEFHSVVANQVFEHVFNPEMFLAEVHRVMKNGGFFLLTVPFVWDEHEQPYDYARYSSFGLSSLLRSSGFVIVEQRKSMNDIRAIFQLLNGYIYKKTLTNNKYLNLLITLVCMAPFNVIGELLSKILPANDDLYLDNVILAKKVSDA